LSRAAIFSLPGSDLTDATPIRHSLFFRARPMVALPSLACTSSTMNAIEAKNFDFILHC